MLQWVAKGELPQNCQCKNAMDSDDLRYNVKLHWLP